MIILGSCPYGRSTFCAWFGLEEDWKLSSSQACSLFLQLQHAVPSTHGSRSWPWNYHRFCFVGQQETRSGVIVRSPSSASPELGLDCTEFYIQKPSLPSSQRKTWSSYKQHNTFKALVAITPTGYISFVSQLWSGNVSDRKITMDCGFLDLIQTNDDIMADRGFVIRDALALRGATLNIPPFTKGGRLSNVAVTKTRRIARARIHVERAIGRLKCFRILDGVIPLSLRKRMDEIFIVCACLCNMDKPLVK